ncbi:hypothetical protein HCI99_08785 [Listeria booriae]|uniref:Uncharacterized protein n=1 Tax=Listeria booriae TaxID=1552123 RepID=A0A7X1CBZ1_9LIST|nr:hypothetical protein [Listeria booriae]MBC1491926.1 hypothetical protein [Listeria booriae]
MDEFVNSRFRLVEFQHKKESAEKIGKTTIEIEAELAMKLAGKALILDRIITSVEAWVKYLGDEKHADDEWAQARLSFAREILEDAGNGEKDAADIVGGNGLGLGN